MKSYRDFDLEITDPARDPAGVESLSVRVAASPAGEQRRAEAARVTVGAELRKECGRLDRRELDLARLIELGRALAEILLPEPARGYFERSRAALGEDEGLRLRLKLDTWGFADLPWEYAWLPPAGGAGAPADATGFLALDPRLSIARYELLSEPIESLEPTVARKLRVVAVLAAPKDERWVPLDLEGEEQGLRKALAPRPEIRLEVVQDATLANLERALLEGAEVFHFAGHGRFQAAIEDKVETVAGKGFLVFRDAEGRGAEVSAETVVVNLRGRGVRLAVLGACEGARRDRINPWTGIAPALIRGGLPAAVAMQATLYDRSAISFSARFYEALAHGLPIDAAVTAGRLAIFNESGPGERDWGVPVLYLRAETGVLFPRREGEPEQVLPPLGAIGWTNVGLSTAALVLAVLVAYLMAHPRLPESWLVGGGIVSTAAAGALAWLQRIAGDESRAAARRALSRRPVVFILGAVVLALAASAFAIFQSPPTVLRVVPGVRLLAKMGPGGPAYALRMWQGEKEGEPDWRIDSFERSGAVVGSSLRVARTVLGRHETEIGEQLSDHLAKREVPPHLREPYVKRWKMSDLPPSIPDSPRRRGGAVLLVELVRDGVVIPSEVTGPFALSSSLEEAVEILFVEPTHVP